MRVDLPYTRLDSRHAPLILAHGVVVAVRARHPEEHELAERRVDVEQELAVVVLVRETARGGVEVRAEGIERRRAP